MEKKPPVFRQEDGWYFWDESYTKSYGPYKEVGIARLQLIYYMHEALGIAAEKVKIINEELKTHNISCTCEDLELIPIDDEGDEIDDKLIPMPKQEEPLKKSVEDFKLPDIPDIWEKPKEKLCASPDSTSSNTVVVVPVNKKKVLSSSVIVTIWAIIITAIVTAYLFSDYSYKNLLPNVKEKQKIEITIKPKEAPVVQSESQVIPKVQPQVSNSICIKDYVHYSQFMGQTEEILKANDFGVSVWENPGASKGNMVGKVKPGTCIEKLDQQGNNVFVKIEGNKVGWIHVMDTVVKK